MLTTTGGGGFTRWKGLDVTRWRSDPTTDEWGEWLYVQDLRPTTGDRAGASAWSATRRRNASPVLGIYTATVRVTVDRSTLRAVQTPQGFWRQTLADAHEEFGRSGRRASVPATDDCGLVEANGGRVTVVEGSPRALKITTTPDLVLAARWLEDETGPS